MLQVAVSAFEVQDGVVELLVQIDQRVAVTLPESFVDVIEAVMSLLTALDVVGDLGAQFVEEALEHDVFDHVLGDEREDCLVEVLDGEASLL